MSDDLDDLDALTIPAFLHHSNRPAPAPYREPAGQPWRMPPPALSQVLRAIKRGHDTFQKLRRACRGRDDREIKAALRALVNSGTVTLDGRRYIAR